MKRIFLIVIGLLMIAGSVWAGPDYVLSDEDLVVTSSAQGFASIPADVKAALISIQGDSIRWKAYTDPEANNGSILDEGDYYFISNPDVLRQWKAILKTGGSAATAYVIYLGTP